MTMTIITALRTARDLAKKAKFTTNSAEANYFHGIQRTLPALHTVTVNQPTARRIAAELVAANVSFVAEPSGLKVALAVKQEDAGVLDASHLGHTGA